MSGAVFARWLAASWRFNSRFKAARRGLILCVTGGAVSSRATIASPAAAMSSCDDRFSCRGNVLVRQEDGAPSAIGRLPIVRLRAGAKRKYVAVRHFETAKV